MDEITFDDTITLSSGEIMHVEVTLAKSEKTRKEIFQPYINRLAAEINSRSVQPTRRIE